MALKVNIPQEESNIGAAVTEAYIRLGSIYVREGNLVESSIQYFYNESARRGGCSPFKTESFYVDNVDFTQDLSIKKILYTHLKNTRFLTSEDV